jgi:hypothetical protein
LIKNDLKEPIRDRKVHHFLLFFIDLGEAGRSISQSGKKKRRLFYSRCFFVGRRQGFCFRFMVWLCPEFSVVVILLHSNPRLVASACEPVASVAELARTHQINRVSFASE